MENFGRFLLERGALTRAQLLEASQAQVVFGGRLGTNLVELGFFDFDELERYLSEHLGVEVAPPALLRKPEPAALAAVAATLVRRHPILPLALEKRTLHVAMRDPCDPTVIDEVAFATGLRIQPYVMAELRIGALIEHHYGILQEVRFSEPAPAARARGAAPETADTAPCEADAAVGHSAELIDEQTFAELHEQWQSVEAPNPATGAVSPEPGRDPAAAAASGDPASDLHRLEVELAAASDRDTVTRLTLCIARLYVRAAALLVVRGGTVSGYRGSADGMASKLDGILISAETSALFSDPVFLKRRFRGAPPEDGVGRRVVEALGRGGSPEVLVQPISIRDRVVNLLYADNGEDPLPEIAVAALAELSQCVSRAYERLILKSKGRFV